MDLAAGSVCLYAYHRKTNGHILVHCSSEATRQTSLHEEYRTGSSKVPTKKFFVPRCVMIHVLPISRFRSPSRTSNVTSFCSAQLFSASTAPLRAPTSRTGIPGATDDALPPSQAPPLFGKLPEAAPSTSSSSEHQLASDSTAVPAPADQEVSASYGAGVVSTMRSAARAADTALATVETMWAGGGGDPSPATCRAALDACATGGQWERALSLVRDAAVLEVTAEASSDRDDGDGEKEESVSGRVEVLALEGRWDEALLLVQRNTGLSDNDGVGVTDH